MNSFVSRYGRVDIHVARVKSDFIRINAFRKLYGTVQETMEQDFAEKEALRDSAGEVFSYFIDGCMIASVRYVPVGEQVSVIESLFPDVMSDSDFNLSTWEGTRFVVHPSFRGHGIFREALALSMEWLRDNTMCQKIAAPIRRRLFPLYERYGFYQLASTSLLIEERKARYMVIMSELITVLNQSVSNGYERSTPKYINDLNRTLNSIQMR